MLKLCFGGKNKTLRAIFSVKSTLRRLGLSAFQRWGDERLLLPESLVAEQTTDRIDTAVVRQRMHAALDQAALSPLRPNAMSADDFFRLYETVHRAGFFMEDDTEMPGFA